MCKIPENNKIGEVRYGQKFNKKKNLKSKDVNQNGINSKTYDNISGLADHISNPTNFIDNVETIQE